MRRLLLFCLLSSSLSVYAQSFFTPQKYPPNSFRNPLDFPISLVGNFGECRSNHFHSGIDIRTNGKENQAVHAIDDGFVSRIKIEENGFGTALYITHLNGYTSLYAHLNSYFPELEKYVRQKQYETNSWKQDIYFPPHQFPIRKGKLIAWSGNTGSSQGPHLHLEIRNTKTENPLNPLLFFASLPDTKAPKLKQIAVYDGNKSIYEQRPLLLPITKGKLAKETIVIPSSKAFLGLVGDDFMEAASGTLGIYQMNLYVNDQAYFAWQMDNISYDITRYMNALADFKSKKNGGPWIQLCHRLPNDKLPVYKSMNGQDGMLDLSDGTPKKITIEVLDTRNNKSAVTFFLQGNENENASSCAYLMQAAKKNGYEDSYMKFTLAEDDLYDNICFSTSAKPSSQTYSYLYQVHRPDVPIHNYFDLILKPKTIIPIELKDKLAVVRQANSGESKAKGKAGKLVNGNVVVSIREFGNYEIVVDQKPPNISSSIKDKQVITSLKRLTFTAFDETTSVLKYNAIVDGKWLRIAQQGNTFYYELDEHFPLGTHTFTFSATDENDNTKTITYQLTR